MKAIVDCNSFYCSCERVFKPDLAYKPVVVLSNNDGCIISISDEAKKVGVKMGDPYFKARQLIEKYTVATFSSNYNLYGNLSMRVMDTLKAVVGEEYVEVYSVDEAFVDLNHIPLNSLKELAENIRDTVRMWTGVKVSVGIAPTKVLAKVANKLSKKNKSFYKDVLVIDTKEKIIDALKQTPISDVWGIGHQYALKLSGAYAINTAFDLYNQKLEWAASVLGGVTGVRLLKELKGETAIIMREELLQKKMIATTRMFGSPVKKIEDLKEAISTYTSRAAEKLRRQHSAARVISVFVVPKEESNGSRFRHGPSISSFTTLPLATSFTSELIKPAVQLVDHIFEEGRIYKKAGVILSGIVPDCSIQSNLFMPEAKNSERFLMDMIDNINFSMRDDMIKFAASGIDKNWKMRKEYHSPRYTTRWDELFEIK